MEEDSKKIFLNEEQKAKVIEAWNQGVNSLKQLIAVAGWPELDGRSEEGRAVKYFLASQKLKAKAINGYTKMDFSLNESQIQFVHNNIGQMTNLEIARALFEDPNLSPLTIQAREVRRIIEEYHKTIPRPDEINIQSREPLKEYRGPRTIDQAIYRINLYVLNKLDPAKLTSRQKQNIGTIISYMNVHRFQMIMNEFQDPRDRDLMESSMIRWLYDKGDVSEEEMDLYINWALDIVNYQKMSRDLIMLNQVRDDLISEGRPIGKALVDQINKLYEEIDSNQKRQKNAQNDLSGKRRDRIDSLGKNNVSILQLVEVMKEQEKRKMLLQLAEARKKKVADEIDRVASMDDLLIEIYGVTKEEILNSI